MSTPRDMARPLDSPGLRDLRSLAGPPKPTPPGPLERQAVVKKPKAEKPPRTPIKPRNDKRAARAFAEDFGPCSRMARFGKCAVPSCSREGRTVGVERVEGARELQACHVVSRGAGGRDHANVIGMCLWHHAEQEGAGVDTFQARYAFSMTEAAQAVADLVARHFCDEFPETFRGQQRCEICQRPGPKKPRHACRLALAENEAVNGVLVLESFYRCTVATCRKRYTHDEAAALKRRA